MLEQAVATLWATGRYERVERHVEYHHHGLDGEMDAVLYPYKGRPVYLEAKSNDTTDARHRANVQFRRCEEAFPRSYSYAYAAPGVLEWWRVNRRIYNKKRPKHG